MPTLSMAQSLMLAVDRNMQERGKGKVAERSKIALQTLECYILNYDLSIEILERIEAIAKARDFQGINKIGPAVEKRKIELMIQGKEMGKNVNNLENHSDKRDASTILKI